jgi:hypothetical protein
VREKITAFRRVSWENYPNKIGLPHREGRFFFFVSSPSWSEYGVLVSIFGSFPSLAGVLAHSPETSHISGISISSFLTKRPPPPLFLELLFLLGLCVSFTLFPGPGPGPRPPDARFTLRFPCGARSRSWPGHGHRPRARTELYQNGNVD